MDPAAIRDKLMDFTEWDMLSALLTSVPIYNIDNDSSHDFLPGESIIPNTHNDCTHEEREALTPRFQYFLQTLRGVIRFSAAG